MILKVAKYDEFITPCTAGTLSYIIKEDGAVKPCEILDDEIGNICDNNSSFNDIVNSLKAKNLRKWIVDSNVVVPKNVQCLPILFFITNNSKINCQDFTLRK